MEDKINVAELLRDCPRNIELDCTIFNNVTLQCVDNRGIWIGYIDSENNIRVIHLTCYGGVKIKNIETKCVIFPKGKTTWEGFVPPCKFKDGDIIFTYTGKYSWISIFKQCIGNSYCTYIDLYINGNVLFTDTHRLYDIENVITQRRATEEEKQKLFDAIKDNGYKWNTETKTLEKLIEPKFKVGDRIKLNNSTFIYTITDLLKDRYRATVDSYGLHEIEFERQDAYELVPNKFDINTLVPFESRVLVRDNKLQKWSPAIWGFYDFDHQDYQYKLVGVIARYCIPYEHNEHLLGTTDGCDEFYKTWK